VSLKKPMRKKGNFMNQANNDFEKFRNQLDKIKLLDELNQKNEYNEKQKFILLLSVAGIGYVLCSALCIYGHFYYCL
jgi:hypothetical protein